MLNSRLDRQAPTRRTAAAVALVLAALVLSAASLDLLAQATVSRSLTGYVYDPGGSLLPGVDVTRIDERQVKWTVATDRSGKFEFTPVGAGTYVLEATLPGFRTLHDEFALASPRDWTRNVTMQVGELSERIVVTGKRPARPAAATTATAGGPLRVGGQIKVPAKVKDVHPIYPAAMQSAGIEGNVPMEAVIGVDGRVVSVRTISAQVHPGLAQAAETAVRQWEFTPTLLNGVPIEVAMTVSVEFSLEE